VTVHAGVESGDRRAFLPEAVPCGVGFGGIRESAGYKGIKAGRDLREGTVAKAD